MSFNPEGVSPLIPERINLLNPEGVSLPKPEGDSLLNPEGVSLLNPEVVSMVCNQTLGNPQTTLDGCFSLKLLIIMGPHYLVSC